MQRASIVGEIFGYLVCLVAVAVFFMSIRGIVNGAFQIGHPTPRANMVFRVNAMHGAHVVGAMGAPRWYVRQKQGQGPVTFPPGAMPAPPPGAPDIATMRAGLVGNARYDAVQRLVLGIVMLIVSIAVFRRAFAWVTALGRS
ncbi:MAG TPA: hypothetical protein VMF11_05870 [Candidatus Baltobacteraceae bacterium]|nr:hypothetical protein [Candidatus Baltobacteraceae bacterium]